MSQVDLAKAVGFQDDDQEVSWNQRDLLLYAVGIGAKKDDYALVNAKECLDKSWAPFPTYPVVLGFKGTSQDVVDFRQLMRGGKKAPGLPQFDPNRIVHGTQSIEILKSLPPVSGQGWKLKRRIVGINENKSGVVVENEAILVDAKGTEYAKLYSATFNLGAKATGANFSKRVAGPPQAKPIPKDRKPDWVVQDKTSTEQAAIYRLSGDYNMLHINPSIGKAAGFGGVILHGLLTFGFAARALVSAVGGGDPRSLTFFAVRFTSPVKPGDAVETSVWELGPGPNGTTEVAFVTKNLATGKVCLGSGMAYVKKLEKGKL
ncbi:peroxisomal dehydratase [Laetiporus sulphureus 93-53]|uniref:Peroxisomal dehydratase n=1 Tax=Laetiporus sulphureus 93-53 TaxID=1314785 RepID=A0A165F291_9APHY|nr:peroxisomal dehydratase [Laetiporus sulphureus 93-53]KZT08220.1 peroxisomal dehydratase [Laetiporus sulphureus 93-53]